MWYELEHQVNSISLPVPGGWRIHRFVFVEGEYIFEFDDIFVIELFQNLDLAKRRDREAFSLLVKFQ